MESLSSSSSSSAFQHSPLSRTRSSIRLLQILPHLSDTGLIQCEIWHASTASTYTCLSSVWGSLENGEQNILVNGQTAKVRRNLSDFLRVARTRYTNPPRIFWIDALCIDQNSISERNHQVSQMGAIYSTAHEVLAWLGVSESIGRACTFGYELGVLELGRSAPQNIWRAENSRSGGQLKRDWLSVVRSPYWKRAWITQEVLLARKLTILVNETELEPMQTSWISCGLLAGINDHEGDVWLEPETWDSDTQVFSTYMNVLCKQTKMLANEKMVSLFHRLPGRLSTNPRDRIYSLLSIATDAGSITVDYEGPDRDVLVQVLRLYSTSMCVCFWFYMVDMLNCWLEPDDGFEHKEPVFIVPMRVVHAEFVMGASEWYSSCLTCQKKVPDDFVHEDSEEMSFCVRELCGCVPGGHLYMRKHETPHGVRYTIKGEGDGPEMDVYHVEVGQNRPSDDWRRLLLTMDIHLTIEVLMALFRWDDTPQLRSDVPFRICANVQQGNARVRFYETSDVREAVEEVG